MTHPINEERRSAVYAAPRAAQEVLSDFSGKRVGGQGLGGPIGMNRQLGGITDEILVLQRVLVLIQHVMHVPELSA